MHKRNAGKPAAGARPQGMVQALFRTHAEVAEKFLSSESAVVEGTAGAFIRALQSGRTLLFFGNGGSAADAQHLAAEFVNRFSVERRALPALALTTDASVLTSIGNDRDFSRVFSRQVEALGRPGDVAVGISTSGRSANVLAGLRAARERELTTVGFTGEEGKEMRDLCDHLIRVPSRETPRIQEVHILVGHILCQLVDQALFESK